jgi:hypothetical protein
MREISVDQLIKPQNIRKLVQKTVDTYPLDWKVVHEAVQNAKDAIQKTGRPGVIGIALDLTENRVTVADDGCGFPYDLDLLGIGGTDKDEEYDWRISGNQGVGIKAVIFSSSSFKLDSVVDGTKWQAWIEGADSYLEGGDPILKVTEPVETPDPTGTRVEYSFPDGSVTTFVNSVVSEHYPYVHDHLARDPLGKVKLTLEYYFRSFSYAGDVNRLLELEGIVPISISLTITARGGPQGGLYEPLRRVLEENEKVEITFENRHWDVAEIVDRTRRGVPRPTILDSDLPEGGNIGRLNDRYVYVGKFTTPEEYEILLRNPNVRRPVDPHEYRALFEQLKGLYVVIGARPVLMKYLMGPPRQFIAAVGIPSAHVLSGPTRGGEASYVSNNIHFIANVAARLNYGKQTIANPRLVGQVSRFFDDAVRATLKNVARALVGPQVGSSSADDIESLGEIEINIMERPDLAGDRLAFKKEPRDENALIAIFSELVGRGIVSGYNLYSISQSARYDARGVMKLSNEPTIRLPTADGDLKNIEFKLHLVQVINDFEEESKFPREISLIVVWEDSLPRTIVDYEVVDIEHTRDADRAMDGVSKCLLCKRDSRFIQLLVLRDVVHQLRQSDQ